jgi:hypothetical protein
MKQAKNRKLIVMLGIFLVLGLISGCSRVNEPMPAKPDTTIQATVSTSTSLENPALIYRQYELKPDDVRFRPMVQDDFIKPSLFSFEYPEIFGLIDLNQMEDFGLHALFSDIDFTYGQPSLTKCHITITFQKPGFLKRYTPQDVIYAYEDAAENITSLQESTITVFGIESLYMKYTRDSPVDSSVPSKLSLRITAFEYNSMIVYINLFWHYFENEPPEVEQYFKHAIETFRFLE